ncbi:hypothetical protein AZE42_12611 [Rhizopogon vesiculosus]|uniref:Uncharacterized protein n=1 Tax=Rhizopogon vesiculosus TaxID=180088 RepID=A0A1J8QKG5_9AGAM|nr:hypothetical protein AZE42_12611 [Rhizopogon vesiculosus]
MLNSGYLSLEVINGTNLSVPSERTPTGFYVIVSTPYALLGMRPSSCGSTR